MQAFIIIYLNVLADTQINDLLPAYRTIISQNLRFYDIKMQAFILMRLLLVPFGTTVKDARLYQISFNKK